MGNIQEILLFPEMTSSLSLISRNRYQEEHIDTFGKFVELSESSNQVWTAKVKRCLFQHGRKNLHIRICYSLTSPSKYNTFAPIDPWIALLVRRMNQRIVGLILFNEILDCLDGPRGLPSLHVRLIGEVLNLQPECFRVEVHIEVSFV